MDCIPVAPARRDHGTWPPARQIIEVPPRNVRRGSCGRQRRCGGGEEDARTNGDGSEDAVVVRCSAHRPSEPVMAHNLTERETDAMVDVFWCGDNCRL